jgi:hypothetical protein
MYCFYGISVSKIPYCMFLQVFSPRKVGTVMNEWPLLIVSYSHRPSLQSGIVWWFCVSCIVTVVLAVIYVFTTIVTSSWVSPNFLSNMYHGLFLWDEVSTECPLFLCNTKIRNANGCDVAQAHGCLLQGPGLSPKAVCVGFMVDRSGTEKNFSDYVGFPRLASFHQCTILVCNLLSILYLSQQKSWTDF